MSSFDTSKPDHAFILSAVDFERLDAMASADNVSDGVRTMLRAKLANSTVRFGSDIPPDIVTIGSLVQIASNGRPSVDVIVGTDARLAPPAGIKVLDLNSPEAIALLGASAGMRVVAPRTDGFLETILIENVRAQPETAAARPSGTVVSFAPRKVVRFQPDQPDDPGPSAA